MPRWLVSQDKSGPGLGVCPQLLHPVGDEVGRYRQVVGPAAAEGRRVGQDGAWCRAVNPGACDIHVGEHVARGRVDQREVRRHAAWLAEPYGGADLSFRVAHAGLHLNALDAREYLVGRGAYRWRDWVVHQANRGIEKQEGLIRRPANGGTEQICGPVRRPANEGQQHRLQLRGAGGQRHAWPGCLSCSGLGACPLARAGVSRDGLVGVPHLPVVGGAVAAPGGEVCGARGPGAERLIGASDAAPTQPGRGSSRQSSMRALLKIA